MKVTVFWHPSVKICVCSDKIKTRDNNTRAVEIEGGRLLKDYG